MNLKTFVCLIWDNKESFEDISKVPRDKLCHECPPHKVEQSCLPALNS